MGGGGGCVHKGVPLNIACNCVSLSIASLAKDAIQYSGETGRSVTITPQTHLFALLGIMLPWKEGTLKYSLQWMQARSGCVHGYCLECRGSQELDAIAGEYIIHYVPPGVRQSTVDRSKTRHKWNFSEGLFLMCTVHNTKCFSAKSILTSVAFGDADPVPHSFWPHNNN